MTERSRSTEHPMFGRLWPRLSGRILAAEGRRRLLAGLRGTVLELGAGDGINFAAHPSPVTRVIAVEPEPSLHERARRAAQRVEMEVEVIDGSAEDLPVPDACVDAAVCCLVLCSVQEPDRAAAELRRVLRPHGTLVVHEHVRDGARAGRLVQQALDATGLWPLAAGGCHLSRDTASVLRHAGFHGELERTCNFGVPHLSGRLVRPV